MDTSRLSIRCGVCCKDMVEPRSLPCGHTYCKSCLQQCIDMANNVQCPSDKKFFKVLYGDAHNLPRNTYIEALLENKRASQAKTVAVPCLNHADKEAEFFCESCIISLCSRCVLQHNGHDLNEYSVSRNKCAQCIQQLQTNIQLFKQDIKNAKIAKTKAVEAQVGESKLKVDAAVKKINETVNVLNAAAQALQNKTTRSALVIQGAFKLENLESLQQEVAELSSTTVILTDSRAICNLESQFKQVDELKRKLESTRSKLVEETIPDVTRYFSDSQLKRSLETIWDSAAKLKQNLMQDTNDYLSLQQFDAAVIETAKKLSNTAQTSKPYSESSTQAKLFKTTSSSPFDQSAAASNVNPTRSNLYEASAGPPAQRKELLIMAGGTDVTFAYDTTSNTWRQVAPLYYLRDETAAAFWNGKMVVAGGWNSKTNKYLNSVEVYDPETNAWTALSPLLHNRHRLALVRFQNTLFAIGGSDGTSLDSVERYNLITKQWQSAASLNKRRCGHCCTVLEVGILTAGGTDGSAVLNSCEIFDGARQTWKFVATLVIARCGAAAATLNGKAYIFGGYDKVFNQDLDSVEEYNCVFDKWTMLRVRLSVPRYELAAATVNGRIYVCGGGYPTSRVVDCFDAVKMQISSVSALPKAVQGAAAVSLPVSEQQFRQLFHAAHK